MFSISVKPMKTMEAVVKLKQKADKEPKVAITRTNRK